MMENIFTISIAGEKLAFYREEAGFTQEELAEKIGSTRVTVGNWEKKDKIKLKGEQAIALLRALNVTEKEISVQPQSKSKEADILDSPLVKSYVEQINLQKKYIEILEKENATLKQRLRE